MAPQLPWLILLENMLYQQLMKSPTFHRGVERVVKTVHRIRHGEDPEEMGGTKLDEPSSRFGHHFIDELRTQMGTVEKEQAQTKSLQDAAAKQRDATTRTQAEDAESAWQELQQRSSKAPKQPFMGDYLAALRGQINKKPPP